ncbi:MAG: 16S rRNA (uracil(1498)-N(3))-methyltransferase [Desulfobacteraceae bacterium]|nr:16S rRNA (uracil(1498)-N(3))-methyltransferase [Desulfobacteraceae bacterium]
MSIRRFMINSRSILDGSAALDGELFRHIVRVLRLSPGDPLTLVDERGGEHDGVIDRVDKDLVTVKITRSDHAPIQDNTGLRLTVCQALPKGEKIDLILQKGTELGAHDFWLFGGHRSIARVRAEQRDAKLERWSRIVTEAARQCGRRTIPAVRWYPTAVEAAAASSHDLRLLLWEDERTRRLNETLAGTAPPGSAIVSIGPEGGFDPHETELFVKQGFQTVSLGSRILRTETAAIAITAILQYIYGDL